MTLNLNTFRSFGTPSIRGSAGTRRYVDLLTIATVVATTLAFAVHLEIGLAAPLWLDESWSGAIASVPTMTELLHQVMEEAGGPIYYLFIWGWAQVFGLSNVSLHTPSLIFSILAPLIAWLGSRKTRPATALAWGVLISMWGPGIAQSGFARCYPLLLCLAVSTTIAFIRTLEAPKLGIASAWAMLAGVMTLTHYYGGLLAGVQGIILLTFHRRHALSLWPSALLFIPVFAWISFHVSRLALMMKPGAAWYNLLNIWDIPGVFAYLIGIRYSQLIFFLAVVVLTVTFVRRRRLKAVSLPEYDSPIELTGAGAFISMCLCVIMGMLRPSFTLRYLTPFEPGIALLFAHWLANSSAGSRSALGALLSVPIAFTAIYWAGPWPLQERIFNYETASDWLAESSPTSLVFLWDNPSAVTVSRDQMSLVGGFFLKRDGLAPKINVLYPEHLADMNDIVLDIAGRDAAIIWLYDLAVHDTTARMHMPELSIRDPGLECRDFGVKPVGVIACRRKVIEF